VQYVVGNVRLTYLEDGKFTIDVGDKQPIVFSPEDGEDLWSLFIAHNEFMLSSHNIGIHTVTEHTAPPGTRADN
jgi:hypothetical protein